MSVGVGRTFLLLYGDLYLHYRLHRLERRAERERERGSDSDSKHLKARVSIFTVRMLIFQISKLP